jgi:hypothetical protein
VFAAACGGGQRAVAPATPSATASTVVTSPDGQTVERLEYRCELTPDAVLCHVTNRGSSTTMGCIEPFLVVKETGDLFNGARKWCSDAVAPGKTDTFVALEGVRPADTCGPALAGCDVKLFEGDDASIEHLAAFIRQTEARATRAGTQPTWRACDEARRAWRANPVLDEKFQSLSLDEADLIGVFCKLHLSPAEVACFGKAKTEADVEACTPDR